MVAATGSFAGEADGSGKRTYFKERICKGTRTVDQLCISWPKWPGRLFDDPILTRKNPFAPRVYRKTAMENILPKFRNEAKMLTMIL